MSSSSGTSSISSSAILNASLKLQSAERRRSGSLGRSHLCEMCGRMWECVVLCVWKWVLWRELFFCGLVHTEEERIRKFCF